MEKLKEVGLARDIGVMNFDQDLIEKLLQNAKVSPATNQIECHFLLQQKDLVKYLRSAKSISDLREIFGPEIMKLIIFLTYSSAGPTIMILMISGSYHH